jgi:hypothetical protein
VEPYTCGEVPLLIDLTVRWQIRTSKSAKIVDRQPLSYPWFSAVERK